MLPNLIDSSQKYISPSTGFPSGSAYVQAKICSEFWREGPASFQSSYYT
jgi:hypothetical protein